VDWFAQSNNDMQFSRNVYLVVLRNDLPSPLARESDEEKPPAAATPAPAGRGDAARPPAPEPVRIDLDGIHRILDMPIQAGRSPICRLERRPPLLHADHGQPHGARTLRPQHQETGDAAAGDFVGSADGKKPCIRKANWSIVATTA
jgi:tricorn protease